ncbi:MAG TPA: Holliday junction branch migration protein RuvA [Gammaproteobacteria bacterium]|nr:Holliday junction branch migration protein RuvA [Gammaproteobacteria bacterium]MDP6731998.1 Holliday junction branch migration protein RuvA [Gammaproteobacteria bacterium]HAJ75078.1 Holliday junction branch migration protein RuvA [Gammaproteobacteria bacterium]
MIGQIRGILIDKQPPEILVEVSGITYEIQVPMSTLYLLPEIGQELVLYTHFVVREDAQLLYGFYDTKGKAMFRSLIRVNGVGPKMALGILSGMEADEFVRTVRNNDITSMVNMPGIGKKTAERLIVEMRDRLGDWDAGDAAASAADAGSLASSISSASKDAETALISLGYKPQQAARAIAQVLKQSPDISDGEELIRLSLRSMV